MNDSMTATGTVQLVLRDSEGNIKETRVSNLVVTAGKTYIASRMASNSATPTSHIAVGTSGTAAAVGDTALVAEIFRKALTVAGGTPAANVVTHTATLGAGEGTGTLQEAGLLNAASGGTLIARTTYTSIVKAAGDSLAITWTITIN